MEESDKKIKLLKFYKSSDTKIKIKLNSQHNIIPGLIIKFNFWFRKNSFIFELDSGTNMKVFIDDVVYSSILPAEIEDVNSSITRKGIPASLRKELWMNYFGENFEGKCFCCKNKIVRDDFEAGHVISDKDGGETILENLKPLCKTCNRSMGSDNLNEYKKRYHQ